MIGYSIGVSGKAIHSDRTQYDLIRALTTALMASKAKIVENETRELLAAACDRNLSAELHYEEQDELRLARMRLLSIDEEEIRIDKPMSLGKPFTLRPRQPITVYFVLDQKSYAFKSQIIGPIIFTDLNAQKKVKGARLRIPRLIRQEQRRHDFRLSLSREDVGATFHALASENADSAPIDAVRFDGRITNLSGGGLALIMQTVPGLKFRINDQFCIVFNLPHVEGQFALPVELRNVRRIHDGESTVIGFQFRARHGPENRERIQRVRKFITDEQRRQLRQMRGS